MPTITSEVREGISLLCHNSKVNQSERKKIQDLFCSIGKIVTVDEKDFEIATTFSSSAPGIIAGMLQNFLETGLEQSNICAEVAQEIIAETFFGTAQLLHKKQVSFSEVISRVATKGGITQEAVKILDRDLPKTFRELFSQTFRQYGSIKDIVRDRWAQRSSQDRAG